MSDFPDCHTTDETLTLCSADSRSKGVWDDYHVTQGRLITGMNPQSATSTAQAALEAFNKL